MQRSKSIIEKVQLFRNSILEYSDGQLSNRTMTVAELLHTLHGALDIKLTDLVPVF